MLYTIVQFLERDSHKKYGVSFYGTPSIDIKECDKSVELYT